MEGVSMPGAFPMPDETVPQRAPKRRFVGRKTFEAEAKQRQNAASPVEESNAIVSKAPRRTPRVLNQIPDEILDDADINAAIELLPPNYSFEIHKTIHRIRTLNAKRVALQMPEGLLMFATTISDILTQFCSGTETLILGDVVYGACCVDDYTARALGCDLLVHYAHSCLIPVSVEKIATLYIFVHISIDTNHLIKTLARNISPGKTIAMVGTIQFNNTLNTIRPALEAEGLKVVVPQIAPLSKGEILGCTAPKLPTDTNVDILLYLGDGRFHLEAAMIANPEIPAYRYDPYSRRLTRETYSHDEMLDMRSSAIATAKTASNWGLILGGLGRQGNANTLDMIKVYLDRLGIAYIELLLSEIYPGKLAMFEDVDCWVQVSCPRLSVDWGHAFARPLLTPYEALVVLGAQRGWQDEKGTYPMDFYANNGLGRTTKKLAAQIAAAGVS